MGWTFEFLTTALLWALIWYYFQRQLKNFPPGPIKFPLLGHLPLLGQHPHKTLSRWKRKYGTVIGIWFGSYRTVVIQDAKLIREAMTLNGFCGRPKLNLFSAKCEGAIRGLLVSEGRHWSEQRRFALRYLRDFGFGRKTMEMKIQEEIADLVEGFRNTAGQPIQAKNLFSAAVVNALWSIMFSERLDVEETETKEIIQKLASTIEDTSIVASLAIFMPWLNKFIPKISGYEKMVQDVPQLLKFIRKQIDKHSLHYVQNQPRDFIDAYMDEVLKASDPHSSFHPSQDQMVHTIFDLFIAGSETTSNALQWMCAYLINYPEVQASLQAEIDEVIGRERIPFLTDRSSMHCTEAIINEVLRHSSFLPLGAFHSTTEDIQFHGFFIPKDTMILANLYSSNHDEESWGDPQNFRPERFIDPANGKFVKNENLNPFMAGRRACIGENLARDELFLFTTSIFQLFQALPVDKIPSLAPNVGMVLTTQPYKMILIQR